MPHTKPQYPGDRLRMIIDEPWQLSYWTRQLDVTPEQLRAAVRRAGEMVCDVKREIAQLHGRLRRQASRGMGAPRAFIARP